MEESAIGTEERIKTAATMVFTKKGFSESKTRDIAKVAGINVSTLHYYFRSKENLFQIIASEAMQEFAVILNNSFIKENTLENKIRMFVNDLIDFFKANPYLPTFLMAESERNPDKIYSFVSFKEINNIIKTHLDELIDKGDIRPISFSNFVLNLIALTIYPFISKQMLCQINEMTDDEISEMLEERKTMVPDMILNYLYINYDKKGRP